MGPPADEAAVVLALSQATCVPDLDRTMANATIKALTAACDIQLVDGFEVSALKHILTESTNMGFPLFGSIRPVVRQVMAVYDVSHCVN